MSVLACRPMRIAGAYALVAAILAAVFAAGILGGGFRAIERSDYMTYHVAARIVLDGHGACLYDASCQAAEQLELIGEEPSFEDGALPYNSPPWLAAVVAPMALLTLHVGFVIFTLIGVAVLGFGAWHAGGTWLPSPAARSLAVMLVLTAWPTVMGAIRGQVTLPVAGLLALSVALTGAGAGAALGLSLLKPTLGPLWALWLALNRRWRELAVAIGIAASLVVVSLVVVSPQAVFDYPAHLADVSAPDAVGVHPEEMINWRGVAERTGGGTTLVLVGTALTLLLVGFAWWRSRSRLMGAAAAFLATPLVIPHSNQHEAILAQLGVLLLIGAAPAPDRRALIAGALGTHAFLWLGPLLQAQSGEASAWLLFGTIGLWLVIAVFVALQEREAGSARLAYR